MSDLDPNSPIVMPNEGDVIPDCSAAGCTGPAEIAALEAAVEGHMRQKAELYAEAEWLRGQHERDLIQVREAHEARRLAEAEVKRMREGWDADVEWANKLLRERDEARRALDYIADGNATLVKAALLRAKLDEDSR